jgi:hypothetical protein
MDSTPMSAAIKRSGARKRTHSGARACDRPARREKLIYVSMRAQEIHHSSTGFPQLDLSQAAHYP